jgi:DNA processing protein
MTPPEAPPGTPQDAEDRFRLARTEGVGPITYRRLLRRYGSAAAALDALPGLARAGGREKPPQSPQPGTAAREIDRLARMGAHLRFVDTEAYPKLLGLLEDAPPVIAVQGHADLLDQRAVALVGGRNASANGQRMAETLAAELAAAGLVVVSGMARGVDAAAHGGALGSGRTVAVIAGGLDCPYPPEHTDLQRRIAEAGAVVAEAPLGTTPQSRHFPRRNRIIAGLVLGVVVVEAAQRSGSLITARLAQETGRELFAVPGSPLDPRARGANDLLRQGAHLTESAADVLDNLPDHPSREGIGRSPLFARGMPPGLAAPDSFLDQPDFAAFSDVPGEAARLQVIELLESSPTPVDDLVRRCQFSAAAVMATLLELELAGRVETLPGNRVALLGTPAA